MQFAVLRSRGQRLVPILAGCALALSLGCSSSTPASPQEQVGSLEQALATSTTVLTLDGDPNRSIISATSKLTIDARVDIGDGSKLEQVSAFGAGAANETHLQAGAKVHGNLTSVGPVGLDSNAKVDGFTRSGSTISLQAGATANPRYENATIDSRPTTWTINFPDTNAGAVNVNKLEQRTLAPGSWGDLQLIGAETLDQGAKLTLTSGTYYFNSFTSNPNTQIFLNKSAGPIYIYVKGIFTYKGGFVTTAGVSTDTLIVALGTGTSAYLEAPMTGTVVAPYGTIDLRRPPNDVPHRGAFFGKNVHVFSDIDVFHAPFDFRCALRDGDLDGATDCTDACPLDPAKREPGLAGCGKSETDGDGDGLPNVIDACAKDPNNQVPGQCGCAGGTPAAAGTPCTDGVCPGATGTTCNGAGVCGNPADCAPASNGCTLRRFDNSVYWICSTPVSWNQAATNCRAVPGRHLTRISSRAENDFIARVVSGTSWHGGTDLVTEGNWLWGAFGGNDGDRFWSGAESGQPIESRFSHWALGQPLAANDCGAIQPASSAGEWTSEACGTTRGYVCEQPVGFATPPIKDFDLGKLFPERPPITPPQQSSSCVPEAIAFHWTKAQAEAQIAACTTAYANGSCTAAGQAGCSACTGIASVPPAGVCPAYTPAEQAQCGLTNVVEAGCVAGKDCCSYVEQVLVTQDFETSLGSFVYYDNAFRSADAGGYASGARVTTGGNPGSAARVALGGLDNVSVSGMSGGFRTTFEVAATSDVFLSFDYNLTQSAHYEALEVSQVMMRVDGVQTGLNLKDYVEQVVGDGDGGAEISTGWRTARLNLGDLAAGTHTIVIGAYNAAKNNVNEQTTLLLDNIKLVGRDDTCADGKLCGPVYSGGCNPCDTIVDGKCEKNCPPPVLRCGTRNAKCANSSISGSRCQSVEVCPGPEATGDSDPRASSASDLSASPAFDPLAEFGPPTTPVNQYYPDPACPNPPCALGKNNRWCRYEHKIWNDPVVAAGHPELIDPTPQKATRPDTKLGESGGSSLKFVFDPNAHLDYAFEPLGVGQASFYLDASASLLSTVAFDIGSAPLRVSAKVDILDAQIKLHLDRCRASTLESRLVLFGDDLLPSLDKDLLFDKTLEGCQQAIDDYTKALSRVKKAYRDALELARQYRARKAAAEKFPADFCAKLTAELPDFFPSGQCGNETAAATVNRFIDYYEGEIERVLEPATNALSSKALDISGKPLALVVGPTRESETLVEVTFPLGPIPMKLEVEAFVEYGVTGALTFELNPSVLLANSEHRETLAGVEAHAIPYALSGVTMFVGAGLGWGQVGISAGVEGAITLGRLSLDNYVGAGIGIQALKDEREFPADVRAGVDQATADNRITLFPRGNAKKYDISLEYNYGSKLVISELLKGAVAGRVRLSLAFFSKEWKKVLFTFPGFGPFEVPLLSGGGEAAAFSIDPHKWGTVQVPFPLVKIPRLDPREVLGGVARAFDTSQVEEVFFDNLCHCSETNEPCTRRADCCAAPDAICFSDPAIGGQGVCSSCRTRGQSCNNVSDCCAGRAVSCTNHKCVENAR